MPPEKFPAALHLLGPGAAGKSTAGKILAENLGWVCADLDPYFLDHSGSIDGFIERQGYRAYARQNLRHYRSMLGTISQPAVIVLSSGFMTYPEDVDPHYGRLRDAIERHPLSVLLLPSFELETCVRILVERQFQRPYRVVDSAREEDKIRSRFPLFMALRCRRVLSDASPSHVARQIEDVVRAELQAQAARHDQRSEPVRSQ